jgi:predicted enzyme related to lactoylglutathione lyase
MILEAILTVMVSDVDKALDFYTKTLDSKLKKKYSSKYAEIQIKGFVIGLHLAEENKLSICEQKNVLLGFRVEDVERSVADLKKKGIKFSTDTEQGAGGKFAFFEDPDSNLLYLWQKDSRKKLRK